MRALTCLLCASDPSLDSRAVLSSARPDVDVGMLKKSLVSDWCEA